MSQIKKKHIEQLKAFSYLLTFGKYICITSTFSLVCWTSIRNSAYGYFSEYEKGKGKKKHIKKLILDYYIFTNEDCNIPPAKSNPCVTNLQIWDIKELLHWLLNNFGSKKQQKTPTRSSWNMKNIDNLWYLLSLLKKLWYNVKKIPVSVFSNYLPHHHSYQMPPAISLFRYTETTTAILLEY